MLTDIKTCVLILQAHGVDVPSEVDTQDKLYEFIEGVNNSDSKGIN